MPVPTDADGLILLDRMKQLAVTLVDVIDDEHMALQHRVGGHSHCDLFAELVATLGPLCDEFRSCFIPRGQ